MTLGRRIVFVLYAGISWTYRWIITFSVLYFFHMFLKPYKLGALGTLLACYAAASMVGWPLVCPGQEYP